MSANIIDIFYILKNVSPHSYNPPCGRVARQTNRFYGMRMIVKLAYRQLEMLICFSIKLSRIKVLSNRNQFSVTL